MLLILFLLYYDITKHDYKFNDNITSIINEIY